MATLHLRIPPVEQMRLLVKAASYNHNKRELNKTPPSRGWYVVTCQTYPFLATSPWVDWE